MSKDEKAYTYMVKCKDGSLYTGWTNDVEKRLQAHNSGKGAKYTRNRAPVELVYVEVFESKTEAMSREYAIKQLTRKKKEQLIEEYIQKGNGHMSYQESAKPLK